VSSQTYRARVAPRRAGGGRPASRIHWDRFGRIVLVLVLLVVLLSYIKPALHVFDTWRESKAAHQRLSELRVEHDRLSKRAEDLESPAAAITEARELGMVAPGETAYTVKGLSR
jgi:cell division protein FtsB